MFTPRSGVCRDPRTAVQYIYFISDLPHPHFLAPRMCQEAAQIWN
jgi:hypothetical protein